jgi:hypothetical protein
MAKKRAARAGGEPRKRPGPEPTGRRPTALTVKGSEEWKAWLERAARYCRVSTSALADLAITDYVKARGFDEPPPVR